MKNEPAFPETRWDDIARASVQWTGMNLRDYFAAHAMQGLIGHDGDYKLSLTAMRAYAMADAMMKAREANDDL